MRNRSTWNYPVDSCQHPTWRKKAMDDDVKITRRALLGTVATAVAGMATAAQAPAANLATRSAPPRALPARREFIVKNAHILTMTLISVKSAAATSTCATGSLSPSGLI